ncbi:MAG: hypothetical protein ABIQ06_00490 [Caldimonas sp.]
MKNQLNMFLTALAAAAALSAAPLVSEARPGGGVGGGGGKGGGGSGSYSHGGGHGGGGYHGGYRGGYYGHRGGWYGGWGYRGYWGPGYYWGPSYYWGVGAGLAALAWSAPYYSYYGGYYGSPAVNAAPVAEYVVTEPQPGDRVLRSGQPVPSAAPPDPIFYPRNGQTPAQIETDRQDCNRWATTQAGAMSDAQIFQRATFACMDGRGYSVR